LHSELAAIAGKLDMELTAMIKSMIDEALPTYRARATQKEFEEVAVPLPGGESPLVKVALDAGRAIDSRNHKSNPSKRINAMIAAGRPHQKREHGVLAAILWAALHQLQKEDEVAEMKAAIDDYYEHEKPPDEPPPFEPPATPKGKK